MPKVYVKFECAVQMIFANGYLCWSLYTQCCAMDTINFFSAVPRIQFTFYITTVDTNGVPGLIIKFTVPCSAYKISYPISMVDTACIHSANIKSKLYLWHNTVHTKTGRGTDVWLSRQTVEKCSLSSVSIWISTAHTNLECRLALRIQILQFCLMIL